MLVRRGLLCFILLVLAALLFGHVPSYLASRALLLAAPPIIFLKTKIYFKYLKILF